jgi:hypothetical protein
VPPPDRSKPKLSRLPLGRLCSKASRPNVLG